MDRTVSQIINKALDGGTLTLEEGVELLKKVTQVTQDGDTVTTPHKQYAPFDLLGS